MKALSAVSLFCLGVTSTATLLGSQTLDEARELERTGDAARARSVLARAAQSAPNDATAQIEYAEFLDRYGDPGCREAYRKVLVALKQNGDPERVAPMAKRLMALDLLAGDKAAAERDLAMAGGRAPASWQAAPDKDSKKYVTIPGPLRSFGRMAAISSDIQPEDVLPALARNVVTNGYQASHSNEALEQTEYLKLVHRYLSQARELEALAGKEKIIKVETCDSAQAGDLLRILGYRMRGGCGSEVVLETVNATRAFLATDSGFPLSNLEEALRTNKPFEYDFHPTQVPVLYGAEYWLLPKEKDADFIDAFLGEPSMCRLYLGLSKLDAETAEALKKAVPMQRLRAYAHVLDFFGAMFEIRGGKAVVPGGARSAAAWGELAGVSPDQGAAFFEKLMARDDGWMASYYDALARISGPVRDYLTEPAHLKRFYAAVRGKVTSPGPARPVFRSNADMMLLTTRLRLDADGKLHVPGSLDVWRNLFVNHPHGKYDGKLTRAATSWKDPDDVIEALFGLCRKAVENEPLKIFMVLNDLDRYRPKPLESATVDRLAREFRQFGNQYSIFNDAPTLTDKSILQFLDTAAAINKIRDPLLRADTAGTMQALVGMWQIFARQGSIGQAKADATFAAILTPFAQVKSPQELFDGGRAGVKLLLAATGSDAAQPPQERLVDLLAGTGKTPDQDSQTQVVEEMIRILEAQRVVSLNTIFELADNLESAGKGGKPNAALVNRLSSRISEIQLPRSALSGVEKNALAFGYWTEKHIEEQRKMNLRAAIERAGNDPAKLKDVRGLLAPLLRDTLVAYNYAHYAPPGAQVLYTNPVFVRSHDFLGVQGSNHTWRATELFGTGWPSNGGGRLVGSLTGLPYALAEAEQNFLVPSQTQALIWGDLVPQMILSAKIPRWWNVTWAQMHWVALEMRYAEAELAAAAADAELRKEVLDALSTQASPARTLQVGRLLEEGEVKTAVEKITPAELFLMGQDLGARQKTDDGVCLSEIRRIAREVPDQITPRAISRAFGTPKPTLANSYQPELLHLRTFPTLMGYSSRIMAESWESNTLYWVALADEIHVTPSQLNVRIPAWTQQLVERIFASHLEDWPALLRSLRMVGDDVRAKERPLMAEEQKAELGVGSNK
jgi:hypothetical protein